MLGQLCKGRFARADLQGQNCKGSYGRTTMLGKLFKGSFSREDMQGQLCRINLCDVVVRDGGREDIRNPKIPFEYTVS